MLKAPITLFTYKRLSHTQRTVESLLKNTGVEEHDLIVYADAARTTGDEHAVQSVRNYLKNITGFRSVTIHHRPHNYGLARSIIAGVTEVLSRHDRIIVMEDDLITSPHFLAYMNGALDRFEDDEQVVSVHGYLHPVDEELPEAFCLRGADCWGWATWRRGWKLFDPDGQALLDQLKQRRLINEFNLNGAYGFTRMLKAQIQGKNDSWAIRWHASAFLANKLTVYPGRSLVQNIGLDGSGSHCDTQTVWDAQLSDRVINLNEIKIEECVEARQKVEKYFRVKISRKGRIIIRISELINLRNLYNKSKNYLPPKLDRWLRKRLGKGISFQKNYKTWDEAADQCLGYSSDIILDKVLASTLKVKRGEAVYERDSVLFDEVQYSWPVTASLMLAAARNNGNLNVLDFGGALGSTYFENREFFEVFRKVTWSIVEQPNYVKQGTKYISDGVINFYETIEEAAEENDINCVLLSSVLQYLQDPTAVIQEVCKLDPDFVVIDKTIVNSTPSDTFHIQKIPSKIYAADYPCRSLSESKLQGQFKPKYNLLSKFDSISFPALDAINSEFVGYIYRAKK